jgi:serine/threonine protein kinase
MRYLAKLKDAFVSNNIHWVVMEVMDDGTVFVFFHANLSEPSDYDQWYESSLIAQSALNKQWGIAASDWKDYAG